MSFLKWYRSSLPKPEVPESEWGEPPSWFEEKAIMSTEILEGLVNGESLDLKKALNRAFIWNRTPQGDSYWNERYKHPDLLTSDDFQFLKELLHYARLS